MYMIFGGFIGLALFGKAFGRGYTFVLRRWTGWEDSETIDF